MGTFYSNCQVRSDSQEAVVEALTRLLKGPAYVAPTVNGWVGVYPEGSRTDPDKLAKQLSARLTCGVFTWAVHDDDIFSYLLSENGKRRDKFNSIPDYFEPVSNAEKARLRGKPEALVPYCLPGISDAQVQEVLHPSFAEGESNPLIETSLAIMPGELPASLEGMGREKYLSASHQASDLARLLGIAEELEHCCYRDIIEASGHYVGMDFVHIGLNILSPKNLSKKLWELPMQVEDIKAAIDQGADVNELTEQGEPFLCLVAFNCAAEVVKLLLSAGVNVNAATTKTDKDAWERGVTALIAAVQGGGNVEMGAAAANTAPQIETVQTLINAGVDVNAKSETGRTALQEAQENLKWFSNRKSDRWYSDEVLAEAIARNAELTKMLRAAGATG